MKIAMICTEKLPVPPVAGGAVQLYITGILPYLSENHDITVFSIQHSELQNEEERDGVKYIRVQAKSTEQYIKNVKERLTDEFELIYVFNRPLWVLELSKKADKAKFILSLHNEMFSTDKISPQNAEKCIERVEVINTVSKFIADGVKKLYPSAETKLNVIYSGAEIDNYKPNWTREGQENKEKLKAKYGVENYRVVLYIGRLSPKKGTHIVLKAMKEIMDEYENIALVIVGSKWYGQNEQDDYTKYLKTLAKELKGPVVLTGFIPPVDIPSHYNLGDIFICASQWREPLARVHYEAMAAGIPIITTNRGGNAEVINHKENGLIINDYSNIEAFKQEVIYLLENSVEAYELGKTSRKLAEERYNFKRVAQDVLNAICRAEINSNVKPNQEDLKELEKDFALPEI